MSSSKPFRAAGKIIHLARVQEEYYCFSDSDLLNILISLTEDIEASQDPVISSLAGDVKIGNLARNMDELRLLCAEADSANPAEVKDSRILGYIRDNLPHQSRPGQRQVVEEGSRVHTVDAHQKVRQFFLTPGFRTSKIPPIRGVIMTPIYGPIGTALRDLHTGDSAWIHLEGADLLVTIRLIE